MRTSRLVDFLQETGVVWKSAAACAIAWEAARLAGSDHPYLAPITVILVIQTTIACSILHAFQRILGTVIGVLLTAAVAQHLGIYGWSIFLLIVVGTGVAKGLKLKDPVLHQVAMSSLLVLVFENHSASYAWDRIRDTVIGAIVGVLIQYIVPPDLTQNASNALKRLANATAAAYDAATSWIDAGCSEVPERVQRKSIQELLKELHQTEQAVMKADNSLSFNPRAMTSSSQLDELKRRLGVLRKGYDHLNAMSRTIEDWAASGSFSASDRQIWARNMHGLSVTIEHWTKRLSIQGAHNRSLSEGEPAPSRSGAAYSVADPQSYAEALQRESAHVAEQFGPSSHDSI